MLRKLKIVTVVNDFKLYDRCIRNSENINGYELIPYDNTRENIGIAKRYNDFIEKNILNSDEDFWIIFCHQDFGFYTDPYEKLKDLDTNFIYGATGVVEYSIRKFKKSKLRFINKKVRKALGRINQFRKRKDGQFFEIHGKFLDKPEIVNTVDCCCLALHSSLIKKFNLKFDENLDWHLYSEELSVNAKKNYGVLTKAVQFDAFHIGEGFCDENFYKSWDYILDKHKVEDVVSTCSPNQDKLFF